MEFILILSAIISRMKILLAALALAASIVRGYHISVTTSRLITNSKTSRVSGPAAVIGGIQFEEAPSGPRRVQKLLNVITDKLTEEDYAAPVWETIKYEARTISEGDMKAATIMYNSILSQPSFREAVIDYVSNQLETPLFTATQIRNLFAEMCDARPQLPAIWALDMISYAIRDSSQPNMVSTLLFNKGFHSLVTYRIANALWYSGRDGLARYFQSLTSRTFGADIHPACTIGHSCVISAGTGIVIGETARIGVDCLISHDVTLGGSGKESGDRHPKLGNGVYLAAGATVLGNIRVGNGAVANAGAVVTKEVEPYTRVGGVPAKLISRFYPEDPEYVDMTQANYNEDGLDGDEAPKFPSLFTLYPGEEGVDT